MKKYDTFVNEGDYKDIPEESQGGDCYVSGYKYFMKNCHSNSSLRLCHGLVTGQGSIKGIKYNHCWCEDVTKHIVYDMTMPQFFQIVPKDVYYTVGQINEDEVFKYDFKQTTAKAYKFGTYGPWEQKLLDNKY